LIGDGGAPGISFVKPSFHPLLLVSAEELRAAVEGDANCDRPEGWDRLSTEGFARTRIAFSTDPGVPDRDWRRLAAMVLLAGISLAVWYSARRRGRRQASRKKKERAEVEGAWDRERDSRVRGPIFGTSDPAADYWTLSSRRQGVMATLGVGDQAGVYWTSWSFWRQSMAAATAEEVVEPVAA
jgi:hypothetical protein